MKLFGKNKKKKKSKKKKKEGEKIIDSLQELYGSDYRFRIQRTSGGDTGYVGTAEEFELRDYPGNEHDFIKEKYGGGTYLLTPEKEGKPLKKKQAKVKIAGAPKMTEKKKKGDLSEIKETLESQKTDWTEKLPQILEAGTAFLGAFQEMANQSDIGVKDILQVMQSQSGGGPSTNDLLGLVREGIDIGKSASGGENDLGVLGDMLQSFIGKGKEEFQRRQEVQEKPALGGNQQQKNQQQKSGITPNQMLTTVADAISEKQPAKQVAGLIMNAVQTFGIWEPQTDINQFKNLDKVKQWATALTDEQEYIDDIADNLQQLSQATQAEYEAQQMQEQPEETEEEIGQNE